jgi:hypothetical protein
VLFAKGDEIDAVQNDIDRMTEWYAGIEKVIWEGGEYPSPGEKVKFTYKVAGITFEMTNTCIENEYPRFGRYKMDGMITGNYQETLEPEEGGTRFTMAFDYQMPGGGVGKIVDRLFVEKMNAKDLEDNLKNLKALVERKDSASS